MSRDCALDLTKAKEDGRMYSTIFGGGKCVMLMDDEKHEFYIHVHYDTGLEKAYNKYGKHEKRQVHRDLYNSATNPMLLLMG